MLFLYCLKCSSSSSCSESESETEAEAEAAYKLIPSLPDDVALNCLARVPRWHHATLSQVSKAIRSLLFSPLYFKTRSLLHATQPVLYLFVRNSDYGLQHFAVSLLNPLAPTHPHLLRLPPTPSRKFDFTSYAALGHHIYLIGCSQQGFRSTQVWVLDCRFNRWRQGPTLRFPRGQAAAAAVLDGKIYVMGGCDSSSIWAEVLDPAVGSWEEIVCPFACGPLVLPCSAVDGKIYARVHGTGIIAYDPRSGVWELVDLDVDAQNWYNEERCLVGGVLYSCKMPDRLMRLDLEEGQQQQRKWKEVNGLDEVLPRRWAMTATLASVGGKLFLICTIYLERDFLAHRDIWCSQVEVRKDENGEFWGTIPWSRKIISSNNITIGRCFAVDL